MGAQALNDSINEFNEVSHKRNINDINDKSPNGKTAKANYTDYVANKLVRIYNAPQSRRFFLKCAWHLSEDTIWTAVENSQKRTIKSPIKYFVKICSKALQER